MAGDVPTGTVTVLFTDVASSTRLWEESPRAMAATLERHDEIVRAAVDDHDGCVFATGDDVLPLAVAAKGDRKVVLDETYDLDGAADAHRRAGTGHEVGTVEVHR